MRTITTLAALLLLACQKDDKATPSNPPAPVPVVLTAPATIYPSAGSTQPRTALTYRFRSVEGAYRYSVNLERQHTSGVWMPWTNASAPDTFITVSFPSGVIENARWRVAAMDQNEDLGPYSPWVQYGYE